jgi:uncharacterized protein (DUF924 family)
MIQPDPAAVEVTRFWRDAGPERWFAKEDLFDNAFRERFLSLHHACARRECDHWAMYAEGSLALMVMLDQFPRNCFRGTAHMFATDPLARFFADKAIASSHDQALDINLRAFIYLPLEHSEAMVDQDRSVALNAPLGEPYLKYAVEHRDIIRRFGRFPHRNRALGRETTPEEQAFLDAGGFAG